MGTTTDNNLRFDVPDVGADDNTWGTILNTLLSELERSITDNVVIPLTSLDHTLSTTGAAGEEARKLVLNCTGALVANVDVVAPNEPKMYIVKNATTDGGGGPWTVGIKTPAGVALDVPVNETLLVWCDGSDGFFTINAQVSGSVALATNSLQLGGVVAANFAQLAVKNTWTNPQIVQANQRTLTAFAYAANADTDTTIVIAKALVTADITMSNPTGTPIDGQLLNYIIEQGSTAFNLTWGSKFVFPDDVNLDLTQTINKIDIFGFIYNVNVDRWLNAGAAQNLPRT